MTVEEAKICAEIFVETGRGTVPNHVVASATNFLRQTCEHFERIIAIIENVNELFDFFRFIILIKFVERIDVFVITLEEVHALREGYESGDQLSSDENEFFRRLMENIE